MPGEALRSDWLYVEIRFLAANIGIAANKFRQASVSADDNQPP
jgi:hypothetical protein